MLLGERGAQPNNRSGPTNQHIFARFNRDLRQSQFQQFPQLSRSVNPMLLISGQVDIVPIRGTGRRWRSFSGFVRCDRASLAGVYDEGLFSR